MAISSPGIGSNIDVNSIVTQLIALERRPVDALTQRKSIYNAELSAFGQISSELSSFQSAASALKNSDAFQVFTSTAADSTVLSATAGSTASAGNHSISVTTLAQAQKLVSTTFADTSTTTLGTGTLTLSNGTDSFAVTIDSSNNTLDGIVNAVNGATGNFGVSASIVNDGTGYRLLLGPNDSGTANVITVTVADGDGTHTDASGLSRLSYTGTSNQLTQTQAATNAVLTVDGLAITKSSNTISDVIQGVTFNLLKASSSTTLSVAVDTDAITSKVQDFATAYNKLANDLKSLRQKGGTLEANNNVLTIQSQLAQVFNTPAAISGNTYSYLAQIGVAIQKDGTISVNAADFKAAASAHLNDVTNLFTDTTQGYAARLYTEAGNLLQSGGVITAAKDGLNANISNLDTRIDQQNTRLTSTEARLRKQFSSLDALLGSLNQTSSVLARLR
jgi:flagellar hook-associated protein 2